MEWRIQKQDKEQVAALAEALGVSPVVAWVLLNRGISEAETARAFLAPSLEQLKPQADMADMDKAVRRLERALMNHETIGVHGDYDVDGISGVALLYRFLAALGGRVVTYLPHRQREGYGLRPLGVETLKAQGVTLLLTVDCGITDHQAIARANQLGLDVIVIDHHQVPATLPPAYAVLNPQRPDCPFNGQDLSGVGAAFYLACALRAHLRNQGRLEKEPNLRELLDLVALGAIADVVPLTGLNRVLVHFGLIELNAARRPWIVQLRRAAGVMNGPVNVGMVAFQLAPRLNAAGRLDSAEPGLRLLLSESEREAGLLADELEKQNRTRKLVEERILKEAVAQVEADPRRAEGPALVVAGPGWHLGVIGIVASRLVEKYFRPAAVIGIHDGIAKGSLRSAPGLNIFKALTRCSDLLLAFGGHPMAAGITLRAQDVPKFQEAFAAAVKALAPDYAFTPFLNVDAEWPIYRVDRKLIDDLARLRPHGVGNPEPSFCARGVLVKWAREARNQTLMMGLAEKDALLTAVGFRMSDRLPSPGARLDLVYVPQLDQWEGRESIKLKIKDFVVLE